MQFTFLNKSSCCGSNHPTQLKSAHYAIDAVNTTKSITQIFDRFYTNYRTEPHTIEVSHEEYLIMTTNLSGQEFSLVNGMLHFRKYPLVVGG